MSDRFKGVYVAFEEDVKDEDAESTIEAIKHIRGVAGVTPEVLDNSTDWMARMRVKSELRDKILDLWNQLSQ